MGVLRTATLAVGAAVLATAAAEAVTPKSKVQVEAAKALAISGGWSRPALAGKMGVGYLTVRNTGRAADTLLGASAAVASRVELHRSSMSANGTMSMAPVAELAAPAGGTVSLAPGGYHLMLIGLKQPLALGQRVPVVLRFAKAGAVSTTLEVRAGPPDAR